MSLKLPPNPSMKVDGFSVYKLYLMMKGHFSGRYDCIKFNWKMNVSPKTYEKRRDKYFFERMATKHNLGELYRIFVANMLSNADAWVGEISTVDALQFYRQHMGKIERASYIFKEDVDNLHFFCENKGIQFVSLFDCSKGQPLIFKMVQQEVISYESFILIDAALSNKVIGRMNAQLNDDIVWHDYRSRIEGYKKLLDINNGDAKEILFSNKK